MHKTEVPDPIFETDFLNFIFKIRTNNSTESTVHHYIEWDEVINGNGGKNQLCKLKIKKNTRIILPLDEHCLP